MTDYNTDQPSTEIGRAAGSIVRHGLVILGTVLAVKGLPAVITPDAATVVGNAAGSIVDVAVGALTIGVSQLWSFWHVKSTTKK